jgi:DNA-binding transcriptional MocR family regulator
MIRDTHEPMATRYRSAMTWRAGLTTDLSTGVPDPALLPTLQHALTNVTTAGTPRSYLDEPVLPELKQVLATDWPYPLQDVIIVDGAMDALDLVIRTHLGIGDRVLIEHPSFTPLVDLLEAVGVELVPIPLQSDGISPQSLRGAVAAGVSALFIQPRAQNPTGITMSEARAHEIADILRDSRVLVIEDDSAGALAMTKPISVGVWAPARTVHIRGYSKSHGPDLRLAAMSAAPDVMEPMLAYRHLGQGWSSRLLQRLLVNLLTDPDALGEVAHARDVYARRRARLVAELARRGVPVGGSDGINIWVPVQDEAAALVLLATYGVGVAPGRAFLLRPEAGAHVRVTCGLVPETDAACVADILSEAAATGRWRSGIR